MDEEDFGRGLSLQPQTFFSEFGIPFVRPRQGAGLTTYFLGNENALVQNCDSSTWTYGVGDYPALDWDQFDDVGLWPAAVVSAPIADLQMPTGAPVSSSGHDWSQTVHSISFGRQAIPTQDAKPTNLGNSDVPPPQTQDRWYENTGLATDDLRNNQRPQGDVTNVQYSYNTFDSIGGPSSHIDSASASSLLHEWTLERRCVVCGFQSSKYSDLVDHARTEVHATLHCSIQPCEVLAAAWSKKVFLDHVELRHKDTYLCRQCHELFTTSISLNAHWTENRHYLLGCRYDDCDRIFAFTDGLERHEKKHQDDARRYPCKYCKKYRGSNGFSRKDHLTQHVRKYHHIGEDEAKSYNIHYSTSCKHAACVHVGKLRNADYIKHMRTVHNESRYECTQPNCDRIGGKGYFRTSDLRLHMKKVHSITVTDSEIWKKVNLTSL